VIEAQHAPIDRAKLNGIRAELGGSFARVLGYFREDGIKSIEQIEAGVMGRSAVALVRPAHTLKGEALQFGALPLALAAERVEKAARDAVEAHGFPDQVLGDVRQLRSLFETALAALEREATASAAPIRRATVGFGKRVGFGRA
jgi:histidine phosphotransfer protein HptB